MQADNLALCKDKCAKHCNDAKYSRLILDSSAARTAAVVTIVEQQGGQNYGGTRPDVRNWRDTEILHLLNGQG